MMIILPPSETKAHGGVGKPLLLDALSFPTLNPTRSAIARDLSELDVDTACQALKLSDKLRPEAELNQQLFTSPTMPAIQRYTGVLYDALDPTTLPATDSLFICSALFGLVQASDMIPHYRLSGGTKLPTVDGATPTMKARWGSLITDAITSHDGLKVDLRSGTYQQLGRVKDAVTVRVEKDGKVVSHFNKHYRGLVARELALAEPCDCIADVMRTLNTAGMQVEQRSETELCLMV